MSRQREIPAELINNIAKDVQESLGVLDVPLGSLGSQRFILRQVIEKTVYQVLSAVEDGEVRLRRLPPLGTLPWEVERKSWLHYKYVFRGQTEWLRSLPEGNLILIAFLPEEIEPLGRSL